MKWKKLWLYGQSLNLPEIQVDEKGPNARPAFGVSPAHIAYCKYSVRALCGPPGKARRATAPDGPSAERAMDGVAFGPRTIGVRKQAL
jgi:hypothetical protein